MKELVTGVFESRDDAEKAINHLHRELGVDTDDISYIYRNTEGEMRETKASRVASYTPGEGAGRGAAWGGALGGAAGLAIAAGAIPAIGPILAAGPLVAALGLGAGALGTAAAGAVTGAAAGGIIGALVSWGVDEEQAQHYEDRVHAGDILLAVHTNMPDDVAAAMADMGAMEVNSYALAV